MTVLSSNHSNFGIQPFFQTLHKSLEPGDASQSDDVAPLVRTYRELVKASAPLVTYARQQRRTHGPGFVCIDLSPYPEQNGTALDLEIGACTVTYHTGQDDLIALGLTDCKVAHALLHHDGAEGLAYVLRGQMGLQLVGRSTDHVPPTGYFTEKREWLFDSAHSEGSFTTTPADAPTAFLRPTCDGGGQPLFLTDGIARTHVPHKFEDSAYKEYLVWRQRDGSMLVIADYGGHYTWAVYTPTEDGTLTTGHLGWDGPYFQYLDLGITQTVPAVESHRVEDGLDRWGGQVFVPRLPKGTSGVTPLPYVRFGQWQDPSHPTVMLIER